MSRNNEKLIGNNNPEDERVYSPEVFLNIINLFKSLGQHESVIIRTFLILEALDRNPNHYFSRKELEHIIIPKMEKEIHTIQPDLQRLVSNSILIRRGLKYHLSPIGTILISMIKKISVELEQNIFTQFTRTMLDRVIYEAEGLDIHSYRHVTQIGVLLKQKIQEIIEKDETFEWILFLDKLDYILQTLDEYSQNYIDNLPIFNQLIQIKAELAVEFANLHKSSHLALEKQISLINMGYNPDEIKRLLLSFENNEWSLLETNIAPFFKNYDLIETPENLIDLLVEEFKSNESTGEIDEEEDILDIRDINIEENLDLLEKFLPEYIPIMNEIEETVGSDILMLSKFIADTHADTKRTIALVGYMPTMIAESELKAAPIKKSVRFPGFYIKDAIISKRKEVDESESND